MTNTLGPNARLRYTTHKYSLKKILILEISSPHNNEDHLSINELNDLSPLSYIKLDDVIRVIQEFGSNSI